MTALAALAGRTLCVGFPGDAPDPETLAALHALGPGGVVLFGRNVTTPEATRALADAVGDAIGRPSLVAVDQEGGRVARLRAGATELPSALAVGAAGDVALAERAGEILGADVRRFGANLDFAPVLDLALDPSSTTVGTRAFGDNPEQTALLGSAVVRGLQRAGVGATLKHFPGHGATADDSHETLPSIAADARTMRARELVPFRAGIAAGAACVMSAHVVAPAFDAERPATLSRAVLTDVLRGELGFRGACVTDCLEMGAIADTVGTVAGGVSALAAGADLLVVSHTLALAVALRDAIVAAVREGRLPRERLEEAVARGDRLRATLAAAAPAGDAPNAAETALELARRAMTLVRGTPALAAGDAVTVVSFEGGERDGVGGRAGLGSLSLALRRRGVKSEQLRVPLAPDDDLSAHLHELLGMQPARRLVLVVRRAFRYAAQRHAVEALLAVDPDAIVVCAAEPLDALLFERARTVACTYGDGELVFDAAADVLTGRRAAPGRLPVDLRPAPA